MRRRQFIERAARLGFGSWLAPGLAPTNSSLSRVNSGIAEEPSEADVTAGTPITIHPENPNPAKPEPNRESWAVPRLPPKPHKHRRNRKWSKIFCQKMAESNDKGTKYFLFRGKPLVLVAASEHYGSVVNRRFDFEQYLPEAAGKKQSVTRPFLLYRELQSARNPCSPVKPESPDYIAPWPRTGPGKAVDGEPKYDRDRWNPEYFTRLHRCLSMASKLGIAVELTVFSNTYADKIWALNPPCSACASLDHGQADASGGRNPGETRGGLRCLSADGRELADPTAGQPISGRVSFRLPEGNYSVCLYSPTTGVYSPRLPAFGGIGHV